MKGVRNSGPDRTFPRAPIRRTTTPRRRTTTRAKTKRMEEKVGEVKKKRGGKKKLANYHSHAHFHARSILRIELQISTLIRVERIRSSIEQQRGCAFFRTVRKCCKIGWRGFSLAKGVTSCYWHPLFVVSTSRYKAACAGSTILRHFHRVGWGEGTREKESARKGSEEAERVDKWGEWEREREIRATSQVGIIFTSAKITRIRADKS